MKTVIIALAGLMLWGCDSPANSASSQPATQPTWGKPVNGLRARLVAPYGRSVFIAEESIPVRLDIECMQAPEGRGGAQIFPHVSFSLDGRVKQVNLPMKNRLHILNGKTYSRHFSLAEVFGELKRPGKYVVAGGHSNFSLTDIGDWTGDVISQPVTIEVLADTPANWNIIERGVDERAGTYSQAIPCGRRTVMDEAEVRAGVYGLDVDTGWSKDGAPGLLRLDLFEKVGLKGKAPSVLIARYSDRAAPGEQFNAAVLRFFNIVGDHYLPVEELGLPDVSLNPEVFEYDGLHFIQIYLDYKGGGPTYTWWLDGSTVVRLAAQDPQGKVAGLLQPGEFFAQGKEPLLGAYYERNDPRQFRSGCMVYNSLGKAALIHVAYRLEKDANGRAVRFMVIAAERERLESAIPATQPAEKPSSPQSGHTEKK